MRPWAPPAMSIRNDAAALGRTLDWLPRLLGMEAEVNVTASGDGRRQDAHASGGPGTPPAPLS